MRILRGIVLGLGVVHLGLFLFVVVSRFVYPVDAEWMTGSIRDTVVRVREGLPIYAPPSGTFVAFLYPPLYFWLSALVARALPLMIACKAVSLAATAATGVCVFRMAKRLGADRYWAWVSTALHVACFSLTLFFYDLERVDPLGAAMVAGGLAVLLGRGFDAEGRRGLAHAAGAGALLGLAFFAKQGGVFALGGAAIGLFLAGERRRAMAVAGAGGIVLVAVGGYLELTTAGWWRYYCLTLPGSHGIEPRLLSVLFITDLPKAFVLAAASVAAATWAARELLAARREGRAVQDRRMVVFGVVVVTCLVAAFSLRAHRGGWQNVLLAWTPVGCAAVGAAARRLVTLGASGERRVPEAAVLVLVVLQLLGLVFDPGDVAPSKADVAAQKTLETVVRRLEQEGDVVVTPVGNLTRSMHYHSAALYDVLRAGGPAPADHLAKVRDRAYAAILVDAPFEVHCKQKGCRDLDDAMARNYFVASRLEEHEHTGMAGFDARPRWVLRPRKVPLEGRPFTELEQRRRVEMGLAAMREQARPKGAVPEVDDAIEQIAEVPDPRWRASP